MLFRLLVKSICLLSEARTLRFFFISSFLRSCLLVPVAWKFPGLNFEQREQLPSGLWLLQQHRPAAQANKYRPFVMEISFLTLFVFWIRFFAYMQTGRSPNQNENFLSIYLVGVEYLGTQRFHAQVVHIHRLVQRDEIFCFCFDLPWFSFLINERL